MNYTVVESVPATIRLTAEQATKLKLLGKKLASKKGWWGSDLEEEFERSVIACVHVHDDDWRITVNNAVGLVAIGDLQITVSPKIPLEHFLYLISKGERFPRIDELKALASSSNSLIDIIALWFLTAAEKLLRGELAKGYSEITDTLDAVRGRILPIETARAFYGGRRKVACQFEDFNVDMPINRVVRAAAELIASQSSFSIAIRRRAKAICSRMEGVGKCQHEDLRYQIDRLTNHYRDVLIFAKYLLSHLGVTIAAGLKDAWTFLIRTPELIEAGIREIIKQEFQGILNVRKPRLQIGGPSTTLNPDFLIGNGIAVGDIKYKIGNSQWVRSDLYQITTFATAFRSELGIVIGFVVDNSTNPTPLNIADISLRHFSWDARETRDPVQSAHELASSVREWINESNPITVLGMTISEA
jgi:5-methylcytosine-specific restriction endonuclease McrBC regulatory subunit McrC